MPPAGKRRRALTLATGLSIAGLLAALDYSIGSSTVLVGLVVFAPLVSALYGDPRDVAVVGALATVLVALSGLWNDNFGEGVYVQRLIVCLAAALIAVLAARNRRRTMRDRERFAVLAATGEIADGTQDLATTVASLNELLVPAVADICIVDAVSAGEVRRLAVRAAVRAATRSRRRSSLAGRCSPTIRGSHVNRFSPSASATGCCVTSPTTSMSSDICARRRSAPRSPLRCALAVAGSAR